MTFVDFNFDKLANKEFDFDFDFDFEWGSEYEYEYSKTSALAALFGSTGAVRLLTRPRLRRFSA